MGRPARIGRSVILRASLDLADERGLSAVTMQAVAERLGVTPMALYRHVANKAALLDAVVESLLGEIELPDRRLPWRERLSAIARAARESAQRHPEVFPLLLHRAANTPGGQRVREFICATLCDAGMSADQALRAERLLSTFMLGFAVSEASGRFAARAAEVEADFAYLQSLVFDFIDGIYVHRGQQRAGRAAKGRRPRSRGALAGRRRPAIMRKPLSPERT
jgi:AcrR family transcriptional regulator